MGRADVVGAGGGGDGGGGDGGGGDGVGSGRMHLDGVNAGGGDGGGGEGAGGGGNGGGTGWAERRRGRQREAAAAEPFLTATDLPCEDIWRNDGVDGADGSSE